MLDVREIMQILPHRFPMLLVDRILDLEPMKYARGYKNISINEPMLAGQFPARWRGGTRDSNLRPRTRVGQKMHHRVFELVPIGFFRHGLAGQQTQDRVQRLRHPVALGLRIYPEHIGIRH